MVKEIYVGVNRHKEKFRVKSASTDQIVDRNGVHLTKKGRRDAYIQATEGKLIPIAPFLDFVVVQHSDYARTEEESEENRIGLGYDPDKVLILKPSYLLGFQESNWNHQSIPNENDPSFHANLLESCYFPRDDAPCMARYAHGVINQMIGIVEYIRKGKVDGDKIGILLNIHEDPLNSVAAHLLNCLDIDADCRTVTVLKDHYPGNFAVEDALTGISIDTLAKDPLFTFKGKGKTTKQGLDQMKSMRDQLAGYLQLSY